MAKKSCRCCCGSNHNGSDRRKKMNEVASVVEMMFLLSMFFLSCSTLSSFSSSSPPSSSLVSSPSFFSTPYSSSSSALLRGFLFSSASDVLTYENETDPLLGDRDLYDIRRSTSQDSTASSTFSDTNYGDVESIADESELNEKTFEQIVEENPNHVCPVRHSEKDYEFDIPVYFTTSCQAQLPKIPKKKGGLGKWQIVSRLGRFVKSLVKKSTWRRCDTKRVLVRVLETAGGKDRNCFFLTDLLSAIRQIAPSLRVNPVIRAADDHRIVKEKIESSISLAFFRPFLDQDMLQLFLDAPKIRNSKIYRRLQAKAVINSQDHVQLTFGEGGKVALEPFSGKHGVIGIHAVEEKPTVGHQDTSPYIAAAMDIDFIDSLATSFSSMIASAWSQTEKMGIHALYMFWSYVNHQRGKYDQALSSEVIRQDKTKSLESTGYCQVFVIVENSPDVQQQFTGDIPPNEKVYTINRAAMNILGDGEDAQVAQWWAFVVSQLKLLLSSSSCDTKLTLNFVAGKTGTGPLFDLLRASTPSKLFHTFLYYNSDKVAKGRLYYDRSFSPDESVDKNYTYVRAIDSVSQTPAYRSAGLRNTLFAGRQVRFNFRDFFYPAMLTADNISGSLQSFFQHQKL